MDRLNQIALSRLNQVEQAVERGIDYLRHHQHPNGEFCCYRALDRRMQEQCTPDSVAAPTAIIANTLLGLNDHPKVSAVLVRAVSFLDYQMMRGGACNYYTLRNPLFPLCPPDVDSTVHVGALFDALNVDYPRADMRSLLLLNQGNNGALYTWLMLRPRPTLNRLYWRTGLRIVKRPFDSLLFWKKQGYRRTDVGKVINANALYYLGLSEATQPILDYLVKLVHTKQEPASDSWYRSPITFYYALGRLIDKGVRQLENVRPVVLERLLSHQQPDGLFGESPLETAQALSALIYWQGNPMVIERTATVLLAQQAKQGEWSRTVLLGREPGKTAGWGSEELTTGFCLEALTSYRDWLKKRETGKSSYTPIA